MQALRMEKKQGAKKKSMLSHFIMLPDEHSVTDAFVPTLVLRDAWRALLQVLRVKSVAGVLAWTLKNEGAFLFSHLAKRHTRNLVCIPR